MNKARYRYLALIWLAILGTFTLIAPYILPEFFQLFFAGAGKGEVIVALVGMVLTYGLGILISSFGIVYVTHKRLRSLHVGFGWSVAVFLWIVGSLGYFVAFGILARMKGTYGTFLSFPPVLFFMLLVFMGFLAFKKNIRSRPRDEGVKLSWLIAGITAVHAIVLSLGAVLGGLMAIPGIGYLFVSIFRPMIRALGPLIEVLSFGLSPVSMSFVDLAIFAAAMLYILLQEGTVTEGEGEIKNETESLTGYASSKIGGEVYGRPEPGLMEKPVGDLVFWPVVAVCATFVVVAGIQFIGQGQERLSRTTVEYLDAEGRPMSAEAIDRVKKAQRR